MMVILCSTVGVPLTQNKVGMSPGRVLNAKRLALVGRTSRRPTARVSELAATLNDGGVT